MHNETTKQLKFLVKRQVKPVLEYRLQIQAVDEEIKTLDAELVRKNKQRESLTAVQEEQFIALCELIELEGNKPLYETAPAWRSYFEHSISSPDYKTVEYRFIYDLIDYFQKENDNGNE